MREEGDTLTHLLGYGFIAMAIGRVEGLVIAICATAAPFGAVAIRTGETAVEGYFLHLERETALQETRKVVVVKTFFTLHSSYLTTQLTEKYPKARSKSPTPTLAAT